MFKPNLFRTLSLRFIKIITFSEKKNGSWKENRNVARNLSTDLASLVPLRKLKRLEKLNRLYSEKCLLRSKRTRPCRNGQMILKHPGKK